MQIDARRAESVRGGNIDSVLAVPSIYARVRDIGRMIQKPMSPANLQKRSTRRRGKRIPTTTASQRTFLVRDIVASPRGIPTCFLQNQNIDARTISD